MGEHSDTRPLVMLLHGFPEYWWSWRSHIEAIANAGYEVAAVDLRGAAGSDKTPDIVDALTLAGDIPALAHALGAATVVPVGLGRGGGHAWAAAAIAPDTVRGALTFSSPHPFGVHRIGMQATAKLWRHVATTFLPPAARKGLGSERQIRRLLAEWSAPGNDGASGQSAHYAAALRLPKAADAAIDQLRWSYMKLRHVTGIQYRKALDTAIATPVWTIRGDLDPLLPERAWRRDRRYAFGPYRHVTVPGAGHFVPEEAPERTVGLVLEYLERYFA